MKQEIGQKRWFSVAVMKDVEVHEFRILVKQHVAENEAHLCNRHDQNQLCPKRNVQQLMNLVEKHKVIT